MRVMRYAILPPYYGRVILIEAEGGGCSSPAEWAGILSGAIVGLTTLGGHDLVLHAPYVDRLADQIREQLIIDRASEQHSFSERSTSSEAPPGSSSPYRRGHGSLQ